MISARLACERFHLGFLERLIRATRPELYALKGGVNLRFFLGSPRYSEDMDLDVAGQRVATETLRKNGYKILEDQSFLRWLRAGGIEDLSINDPSKAKQTATTQRFRAGLILASGERIPTKIEFSRRSPHMGEAVFARIDTEVARLHQVRAFSCFHYGARQAATQKIQALADRSQPQARDLFDLYLLESRGEPLHELRPSPSVAERAVKNLLLIDFEAYRSQVVEFLPESAREEFGTRAQFDAIQERLLAALNPAHG